MLLAYAILLPDDVHNFMRSVQAELYTRYGGPHTTLYLEPHVTLKQPFETADVGAHERYLDRLAGEIEPFELRMSDFGFWDGEGVVFVDVEQDERLLALQHRILDELDLQPAMFESGEPVPYHFHGTLTTRLSEADFADAQTRLPDPPKFRFPLERLGLFRKTEDTWTLYKRVRL